MDTKAHDETIRALGDLRTVDALVAIMAKLRGPGGCPWDHEQTHQTLKSYLLEETYEVLEAVDGGDMGVLAEELGDVLLQIVFHAQIASERGDFELGDAVESINRKLIRRHPHVFGEVDVDTADEVYRNWNTIKRDKEGKGLLDGIPRHLPALARAYRLTQKAASVDFDWIERSQALAKVHEEVDELEEAAASGDMEHVEEELGDLLFMLVNYGRHLAIDAEQALTGTIDKFLRRFSHIEAELARREIPLEEAGLALMDQLWDEAKALERGEPT